MEQNLIKLIPLFPLIGFALWGIAGKRTSRVVVGLGATMAVTLSFVCAVFLLSHFLALPGEARHIVAPVFSWMTIPVALPGEHALDIAVSFLLDPLSLTMTLIVTGVSALIHFYAMGYMAQDARYSRFFSLMNLFVFFMLILVLADSFPVLFVGWEGVGLCSYLLIEFWWEDMANAAAGTKAFIVNRIGDFGFLVALLWIFLATGSLHFADVFAQVGTNPALMATTAAGVTAITAITLLLFLGATGKSAQIPLYVWLPDAMAGPTPVSALIHAATMVTAGVYMVARCWPMFDAAPQTQVVIAYIGALTAFFAATIAITQFDLKRVLAYSTVSQLGYMMIGVGVGAYSAGIFHVFTHAFFKACLFLGAGAVMHGLANNIDMRFMGGLRRYMKGTAITYFIAVLAIAGVPPLAGFFSKDEILAGAFDRGGAFTAVGALGLFTAFITAFYMFRSYYYTFEGEERINWPALKAAHEREHGHAAGTGDGDRAAPAMVAESEKPSLIHEMPGMTLVLWALAAGSAIAGIVFGLHALVPGALQNLSFSAWLEPTLKGWWPGAAPAGARAVEAGHGPISHQMLGVISAVAALAGWGLAWAQHKARMLESAGLPAPAFNVLFNKYYVDELYAMVFQRGGKALGVWLWQIFDDHVVDGLVNGTGAAMAGLGEWLRRWTTGFVRSYAFSILAGSILILGYMLYYAANQAGAAGGGF